MTFESDRLSKNLSKRNPLLNPPIKKNWSDRRKSRSEDVSEQRAEENKWT